MSQSSPHHVKALTVQAVAKPGKGGARILELLQGFAESIARNLVRIASIEPDKADQVAVETVEVIAEEFGGQAFYMPSGRVEKNRSVRDEEIYRRKRDGEHVDDLARAFKLSRIRIFQICARCTKEDERAAAAEAAARDKARRAESAKPFGGHARPHKTPTTGPHPWTKSN